MKRMRIKIIAIDPCYINVGMVKLSYIQFDRLLIAQSQVKKMTLATVDGAFVGVASALPNRYEIDRL
jgi:PIN domain nuclease of toxin-antitoxin system